MNNTEQKWWFRPSEKFFISSCSFFSVVKKRMKNYKSRWWFVAIAICCLVMTRVFLLIFFFIFIEARRWKWIGIDCTIIGARYGHLLLLTFCPDLLPQSGLCDMIWCYFHIVWEHHSLCFNSIQWCRFNLILKWPIFNARRTHKLWITVRPK